MARLIQLPDGNWIDPAYVLMVEVMDKERSSVTNITYAPRVIIHIQGDRRVIDCESLEDAKTLRDDIAAKVNV